MSNSDLQARGGASAARRVVGAVIVVLSLLFIYRALRFFSFSPEVLGKYFPFKWIIMGHVAGGLLALLLGPLQLSRTFRARYRRVHRVIGRVYVSAVGVGALCALILASTTAPAVGWAYALSLHMLASVWGVSALLAWRTAVHRRFGQHEEWADRSYIATVAFVAQSLLLEIPLIAGLGSFAEVSTTIIWSSWTVPMFVYDCLRGSRQRSVQ
jgi:hypothetical protein